MDEVSRRTVLGAAWAAPVIAVAVSAPAAAASTQPVADTVVLAFTPTEVPATLENRRGYTTMSLTNVGDETFVGTIPMSVSQSSGPSVVLAYDGRDPGWSLRSSVLPTTVTFTGTIAPGATTRFQLAPTTAPGNPTPWAAVVTAQAVDAPTTREPATFTLRASAVE